MACNWCIEKKSSITAFVTIDLAEIISRYRSSFGDSRKIWKSIKGLESSLLKLYSQDAFKWRFYALLETYTVIPHGFFSTSTRIFNSPSIHSFSLIPVTTFAQASGVPTPIKPVAPSIFMETISSPSPIAP